MKNVIILIATVLAFAAGVLAHRTFTRRIAQVPSQVHRVPAEHRCQANYYNQAESYETFDAYCFGMQFKLAHEAWAGNVEVVKRMLEDGANADSRAEMAYRPLEAAAGNGHTEVVKLLLDHGANVNHEDYQGGSPFMSAVLGGHADTVSLLISRGADIKIRSEIGKSALQIARERHFQEVVDVLEKAGAPR